MFLNYDYEISPQEKDDTFYMNANRNLLLFLGIGGALNIIILILSFIFL